MPQRPANQIEWLMWMTSQISLRPRSTRCRRCWRPVSPPTAGSNWRILSRAARGIDALQALVAAARAERDAAIAERDHALSQMDRLRHLLRQLQRAQFGRRSEKLDPDQLQLAIEDIEQAIAANEAAEDKKAPAVARKCADKRRADRGAIPAHLPRIDVTIAPEDTNCPCCRAPMHVIGEETSKRLDVVPAQFRVIVCLPGLHGWRGSGTGAGTAD